VSAIVNPSSLVNVTVPGSSAQVNAPANALVRSDNGAVPTGSLTVALTPIDPASDSSRMPGDFTTLAGGTARQIESFGALGITIQDANGNRYNLANGKTAIIRIPVSAHDSATLPPTIPLFYLDETNGRWIEEGNATLGGTGTGRYYEGIVSHFSYWNVDRLFETIYVNGCIEFNGVRTNFSIAETDGFDYIGIGWTFTDLNGNFRVPMRVNSRAVLTAGDLVLRTAAPIMVGPSATDITLAVCLQLREVGTLASNVLAPSLVAQPQSVTSTEGTLARFSVIVDGKFPIGLQWRRNGVNIPGATGQTLVVVATLPDNAANYSAVATNANGSATSANATLSVVAVNTAHGFVSTVAGVAGLIGSADGSATAARFHFPDGVATDSIGNVYVADTFNQTIRRITPAGLVSTLAGVAGQPGSTDGLGAAARFSLPASVTTDSADNLYVADFGNHTIRKVTSAGQVSTIAGVALSSGSADGAGVAARFFSPGGLSCDSAGNVYVADYGNHTIRKITSSGLVSTLAGTAGILGSADGVGTAARFNRPAGLAIDGVGNIYVGDSMNHTIRKITPAGLVSTVAGLAGTAGSADGLGLSARFSIPSGVVIDNAGTVYVADNSNNTIRKITPAGLVSTIAGVAGIQGSADGIGPVARFWAPVGLAITSAGNIYVADQGNHLIRKIAP
jgi:sugar lactone lactonase YvrE